MSLGRFVYIRTNFKPALACYGRLGLGYRDLFGWPSFNREKRAKKREAAEKKLAEKGKGFLEDLDDLNKTLGKKYKAQAELIPKHKSALFPHFSAPAIDGSLLWLPLDSPFLVLLHFRSLGQSMCLKYRTYFEKAEFEARIPVVELTCLDKWSFKLSQQWIQQNLCTVTPRELQKHHMVIGNDLVPLLHSKLSVHNKMVGYVFLVDKEGRIRWRAHAEPAQSELQALVKCTKELLQEDTNTTEHASSQSDIDAI